MSLGRAKVTCPRCRGSAWTDVTAKVEGPSADGTLVLRLTVAPIAHECEILDLPADGVLVVRNVEPEALGPLIDELRARGRRDLLLINLIGDDESIATLSDEEMRGHGWVRAPQ